MKIEALSTSQSTDLRNTLRPLNFNERIKRCLKSFSIGLGLALICLPIPGLHFFLVPFFLFYSVYSGYVKFRQNKSVHMFKEFCPLCQKEIKENTLYFDTLPHRFNCSECQSQLRVISNS